MYDIEFINFKIRDFNTGKCIFEVNKNESEKSIVQSDQNSNRQRFIRYDFSPSFLKISTIGAS